MTNSVNDAEHPAPTARFVDAVVADNLQHEFWEPVLIRRDQIEAEIERLADGPIPDNGRRESLIVHPASVERGLGLAPGTEVRLSVLRPGESTAPKRHNATEVNFVVRGTGTTHVGGRRFEWSQHDVWNHPGWTSYQHTNDGDELSVRLTYSNASLLERMRVHLIDDNPADPTVTSVGSDTGEEPADPTSVSPYGTFQLTDEGAHLMPYETLISPDAIESRPLLWPWKMVKAELDKLAALGADYVGRRLYLLYNPRTGRTNGTTPNFFATITIRPPGIVDRPHRHVSSAINYYFRGHGYSRVAGRKYEWAAGDLMLSAPGWATHNHASGDEAVYELTIQDQPLNIVMESLLWQEDLKHDPILLGANTGFATNRRGVA